MALPLIAAAAAVVGGIAGGQKDSVTNYQEGGQTSNVNLIDFTRLQQGQSGLEANAYDEQGTTFSDLSRLINQLGPGGADIAANGKYQNQFMGQLQDMLQKMNNPTAADSAANFGKAKNVFAPQQVALNQQFEQANTDSNRLAARLGRAGNDPILRNKLMQEKTRQQTMLDAQTGSYAQQLPQQEANNLLTIGGQISNLRQGLATQALTNRQTLLGMGNQLTNSERQYRLNTAQRASTDYSHGENLSGGGFKGAVTGAVSTAGSVMSMGGGMSDVNQKENVVSLNVSEITKFLDVLTAYKYEYKDPTLPGTAEGTMYGVLAQDLEKSAIGKTLVVETEHGKMLNVVQGFGTVLAVLSEINGRLKKLEGA